MRLIGRIVIDYFIDLFNRSSRDYREVSKKLSEMKSLDKINQQEERIRAQSIAASVKMFIIVNLNKRFEFLGIRRQSRSSWSRRSPT